MHILGDGLRQCTIFATFHVQTLHLGRRAVAVLHLDRGILLLLQEQQSLEDAVEVDLEQLVAVVDCLLKLGRNLESFGELGHIGVDED